MILTAQACELEHPVKPRVLVIQQDPHDDDFLDDATIRNCLTHADTPYLATEEECGIERIRSDRFETRDCTGRDLIILEYCDSSHSTDRTRFGHLLMDVPVILLVDEQHRHAAEAMYGGLEVDVIVRTSDLEFRLIDSLIHATMRHRLSRNARELSRTELVQQAMLPAAAPESPGLEVAARNQPAEIVGGDFFDYGTTTDNRNFFVIGDVTGHGLNAALRMAEAQAYFRAFLRYPGAEPVEPGTVLHRTNGLLAASGSEMPLLATAMVVSFSVTTRSFVWAGAGHQGFLLRATGEIERLHSTGPVLGCVEETEYSTIGPRHLDTGDTILMTTDGIAETCSGRVQLFGRNRMLDCIHQAQEESAAGALDRLFQQAQKFRGSAPQKDDMTAVLIRVRD